MKTTWNHPVIEVQKFAPNEFCSACGDSGTVYKFECNGGQDGHSYYVYVDSNKSGDLDWGDTYLGSYHPCHKKHDADTTDEFLNGFIAVDGWGGVEKVADVIIWRGESGNNIHCTTELNKENWEITKS